MNYIKKATELQSYHRTQKSIFGHFYNNDIENIQEVYCSKNLFGKDKMIKRDFKIEKNN